MWSNPPSPPPAGLITVSCRITREYFLSAIRIWLYFPLSGTWESVCDFSLSLHGRGGQRGAEVEGSTVEPDAVSLCLFTGCIQRVEPTVGCESAHGHSAAHHLCVYVQTPLIAWTGERPVGRVRSGCWSRLACRSGRWSWQTNLETWCPHRARLSLMHFTTSTNRYQPRDCPAKRVLDVKLQSWWKVYTNL